MSANPSMMKSDVLPEQHEISRVANHKSIEYRVTHALVFLVCLAITGLCRLLPRNRHPWIGAGDDHSASLWTEARSAADSTVPYIFQQ